MTALLLFYFMAYVVALGVGFELRSSARSIHHPAWPAWVLVLVLLAWPLVVLYYFGVYMVDEIYG